MKILFLLASRGGGGAERQTGYLADELARRGHEVRIATREDALPQRDAWNPLQIRDHLRVIRDFAPDVVQSGSILTDVVGGIACALARVPFVVREPNVGARYARGLRFTLRRLVVRATARAVVANSSEGARYWRTHRVIANGIPFDTIAATTPAALPRPAVLYVGRLVREKNVDVVLRAFAALDRQCTLILCGEGPERPTLEHLATRLGIANRTQFLGFVDDVCSRQRAADFGVLVSDVEGQPNVVAEGFAAGLPMIVSDIAPHREMATASEALFVQPRDVEATARAMRAMLDDPSAARERAARARERARAWSIEAMASHYESLYRELLA